MTHFLIFLLAIFASNLFTDHLSDMKLHGAQKFRCFRGRVSQACPIIILALASILPVTSFAQSAPQVIVAEVRMADWFDSIEALGTLRANETVVLTASVTDTITHIHFEDGQRIEKDFVLAEMTDQEESALVREMSARLDEAKRQLKRLKELPNKGAVSEALFDQRTREFEAAKAQLEAMKSRLQDRLIIAPFSGVLGLRNISIGALVSPGDEIVTLTDDSVMKLDFAVPAIFLSSLETGLPVVAKSNAYPQKLFEGAVTGIDSRVDPVTRSITVRAKIPNPENLLRPGLLMNVDLRYRFRKALTVPEEAIVPSGGESQVLVVAGEPPKVEKKMVTIGRRVYGDVEILGGVAENELVVTHGTQVARPGVEVKVTAIQKPGEEVDQVLARARAVSAESP